MEWELFGALPPTGSPRFSLFVRFCEAQRPQVLAALPWAAAEAAGNDGFDAMLEFISRWGGNRFYVPANFADFSAKAGVSLGRVTHRRFLKETKPASLIDLPSAWGVFLALRRVAILSALARGDKPRVVARQFGITERGLRA
ncbi:MAG TPA: hypothetical protein VFP12_16155 [Allosphingosinicella sp.]|nr:hypothetical protein [Allosphingosinicella sp.]